LRREAAATGLPRDFAIYDDDDQLAAVKLAMAKLQIEDDSLTPRKCAQSNQLREKSWPDRGAVCAPKPSIKTDDVPQIFSRHTKASARQQGPGLSMTCSSAQRVCLRESTAIREKWQARFQYIHVDEYQDTNRVANDLMRLLTGPKQNVCVVGDEDQSIYRWRGADVSILLSFSPADFPAARIVKLERNYRSTQKYSRRRWCRRLQTIPSAGQVVERGERARVEI